MFSSPYRNYSSYTYGNGYYPSYQQQLAAVQAERERRARLIQQQELQRQRQLREREAAARARYLPTEHLFGFGRNHHRANNPYAYDDDDAYDVPPNRESEADHDDEDVYSQRLHSLLGQRQRQQQQEAHRRELELENARRLKEEEEARRERERELEIEQQKLKQLEEEKRKQREAELEKRNEAATIIQSAYRIHQSLNALKALESKLAILKSSFVFPPDLELVSPNNKDEIISISTSSSPTSISNISVDDLKASKPKLAYTAANKPIHATIESLSRLLTEIDSVESRGDSHVRERRKKLVRDVEAFIAEIEGDDEVEDEERRYLGWKGVWRRYLQDLSESSDPSTLTSETEEEDVSMEIPQSDAWSLDVDADTPSEAALPFADSDAMDEAFVRSQLEADEDIVSTPIEAEPKAEESQDMDFVLV